LNFVGPARGRDWTRSNYNSELRREEENDGDANEDTGNRGFIARSNNGFHFFDHNHGRNSFLG